MLAGSAAPKLWKLATGGVLPGFGVRRVSSRARFPVRPVPPPALGHRAELSVSAFGRAGVRGLRKPERGERVGGGPAPAQQADTGPNFPRGPSFHRQSPCVTLQSLLLVKPARGSAVLTQAILPFDIKIHFLKILFF